MSASKEIPRRRSSIRDVARNLSASLLHKPLARSASSRSKSTCPSISKAPSASDFPSIASIREPREYRSRTTGTRIVGSSGPSKWAIEDRYTTSTLVTLDVHLEEAAHENSIGALDTAACSSSIWAFEARTKFPPSEIHSTPRPMQFGTAAGPMLSSSYVVAEIYLPCTQAGSNRLAKTTAILFLRDNPPPGGVDILLGMDYIDAQSIPILTPLKMAILGRCGNAQVSLAFDKGNDTPLRRGPRALVDYESLPNASPRRRGSFGRVERQVFIIIAPIDTSSGKSETKSANNSDSIMGGLSHWSSANTASLPSVSSITTPRGPHSNPLLSNRIANLALEVSTPIKARASKDDPKISRPVLNPYPGTLSGKEVFCQPRSAPQIPTRKVFVRKGIVFKKTVSRVIPRVGGNALASADLFYESDYGTSSSSSSSRSNKASVGHEGSISSGIRRASEPTLKTKLGARTTTLTENVIPPNACLSQLDPITSARYGAEEDSINVKGTWI